MRNGRMVVFEVGVGNPQSIRTDRMLGNPNFEVVMFEPNPETYIALTEAYGDTKNLTIHNVALFSRDGEIEFCKDGDSSYVAETSSPTVQCAPKEYSSSREKITVACRSVQGYDDGSIDILMIDTEGSEWPILSQLISRPRAISVEMGDGSGYTNEYYELIEEWMSTNGYALAEKDRADHIYIKS